MESKHRRQTAIRRAQLRVLTRSIETPKATTLPLRARRCAQVAAFVIGNRATTFTKFAEHHRTARPFPTASENRNDYAQKEFTRTRRVRIARAARHAFRRNHALPMTKACRVAMKRSRTFTVI
jgi:hypothetical protein